MDDLSHYVREAQQGSEAAVELIIRLTYDDVYRFIRWKVHDEELAWDLAQMTYEKAWLKLEQYTGNQGSFYAWLLTIANHTCIDHVRSKAARQGREQAQLSDSLPQQAHFLDEVLMREDLRQVYLAMDQLSEAQREALLLRYKHELSFVEMAQAVGVSESTIKSRVRRGLLLLRDLLQPAKAKTKEAELQRSRKEKGYE